MQHRLGVARGQGGAHEHQIAGRREGGPVEARRHGRVVRVARVLAVDTAGAPALFQLGVNAFGFSGHPGFKAAMAEDLIMEFEEGVEDPGPTLNEAREAKREIEDALVPIMTGLIQQTGLMEPRDGVA